MSYYTECDHCDGVIDLIDFLWNIEQSSITEINDEFVILNLKCSNSPGNTTIKRYDIDYFKILLGWCRNRYGSSGV